MDITVLIPTANRPHFLATSLASVARQTALNEVTTVLVSENAGNRASEAVCRRFPDLPIRYVFQDPPLPPWEHGYRLVTEYLSSSHVAFLFDDDWWASGHLAGAVNMLRRHPDCGTSFAGVLRVVSESSPLARIYIPVATRLAAGSPPDASLWPMTPAQVITAAWLATPFHMSTMVVKTAALRAAVEVSRDAPGYYNDRLLIATLAREAPVVFDPSASVYVRVHGGSDSSSVARKARARLEAEAQAKIESLARPLKLDLAAGWRELLQRLSPETRAPIYVLIKFALGYRRARELGLPLPWFASAWEWQRHRVRRRMRLWLDGPAVA